MNTLLKLAIGLWASTSAAATLASQSVQFEVCSRADVVTGYVAGGLTGAGLTVAGAEALAAAIGITAVPHVAGGTILAAYGSGGYLAGTLGTAGATALGLASTPLAVGAGLAVAGVGAIGGGAALYCHYSDYRPVQKLKPTQKANVAPRR